MVVFVPINMRFFTIAGIAETCSTILLFFVAMPLKYIGNNEILVKIIGPIHGILWFLYIGLLFEGVANKKWDYRSFIIGGFMSMFPGGPIWFEKKLLKYE